MTVIVSTVSGLAWRQVPDLIISMPGLDGVEMVKQLKGQSELKNVPILVLTAMGKDEIEQAIRAGANGAMNKPVLLDALVDDVRELLAEAAPRE